MKHQAFITTITVNGSERAQIWDPLRPMTLGYSLPWSLAIAENKVYLRHRTGKTWQVSPDMIEQEIPVDLPDLDHRGRAIKFRMRRAIVADPVTIEPSSHSGEWFVFVSSGSWVLEQDLLDGSFTGRIQDRNLFTVTDKKGSFHFKTHDPGVEIRGGSTPEAKVFSESELALITVHYGPHVWSFSKHNPGGKLALGMERAGSDQRLYRMLVLSLAGTFAILLTLLVALGPAKPPEEEKKPEMNFARVRINRPLDKPVGGTDGKPPSDLGTEKIPQKKVVEQKPAPKAIPKQLPPTPRVIAKPAPLPQAPPKPKVDMVQVKALAEAKKIQNNLAALLKTGASQSNVVERAAKAAQTSPSGSNVLDAQSKALASGAQQVSNLYAQQDLNVGSASGGSYQQQMGGSAERAAGSGGGGLLSVAGAGEGGALMSEEGLTKREVWEVIQSHLSEIRNCYEKAILRKPKVEGKLNIGFTISRQGIVKTMSVKNSSVGDPFLDHCVMERLGTWKFPQPKGNIEVPVTYPFVFKRL